MSYIPNQKNTVLFVDEAPLLDKFYRRALPYNPSHLIDRVADLDTDRVELLKLELTPEGRKLVGPRSPG